MTMEFYRPQKRIRALLLIAAVIIALLAIGKVSLMNSILEAKVCWTYTPEKYAKTNIDIRDFYQREAPAGFQRIAFDLIFPARIPRDSTFLLVAYSYGGLHILYDGPAQAQVEVNLPLYDSSPPEYQFEASLITPGELAICHWTDEPDRLFPIDGPRHWNLRLLPWIEEDADGWRHMMNFQPA